MKCLFYCEYTVEGIAKWTIRTYFDFVILSISFICGVFLCDIALVVLVFAQLIILVYVQISCEICVKKTDI